MRNEDSKKRLYNEADSEIEISIPKGMPEFLYIMTGMHIVYGSRASNVESSSIVVIRSKSSDSMIDSK